MGFLKQFFFIILVILLYVYIYKVRPNFDIEQKRQLDKSDNIISESIKGNLPDNNFSETFFDKIKNNPTSKAILSSLVSNKLEKDKVNLAIESANNSGAIRIQDVKSGNGTRAYCGSKVKFHYELFGNLGVKIFSTKDTKSPIDILLGKGEVIRGIEQGLVGMRKGGIRKVALPPSLAFDDDLFENQLVESGQSLIANLEILELETDQVILDLSNNLDKLDITKDKSEYAYKKKIECSSKVTLEYKFILKGKDISESHTPSKSITTVIGKNELPLLIEQALMKERFGSKLKLKFSEKDFNSISENQLFSMNTYDFKDYDSMLLTILSIE